MVFEEDEEEVAADAEGVGDDDGDVVSEDAVGEPDAHAEGEEEGHAVGDVGEVFSAVAFDELGDETDGGDGAGHDSEEREGINVHGRGLAKEINYIKTVPQKR